MLAKLITVGIRLSHFPPPIPFIFHFDSTKRNERFFINWISSVLIDFMATSRFRLNSGLLSSTVSVNNNINCLISLDDSFEKTDCLVSTWKPLLYLLQFWGFHTAPVSGRRFLTHFRWSYLLYIWAAVVNLLNLGILGICIFDTYTLWTSDGPFHNRTVSSIITGVLPLQNLVK